jgi:D-arabinose 1-dehydrogenase-like Zn-dependent alcohol dehydrogenase
MGFRTVAIGLGRESEKLAKELGAHEYIDSGAEDGSREIATRPFGVQHFALSPFSSFRAHGE